MKQLQPALIALLLCGNAVAQSGQKQTIRLAQADISSPGHVEKSELEKAEALEMRDIKARDHDADARRVMIG